MVGGDVMQETVTPDVLDTVSGILHRRWSHLSRQLTVGSEKVRGTFVSVEVQYFT